jgi:hypothetical protein
VADLSTLQDIALIVGPVGAAIAAGASLASVRQTRRIAVEAALPDLAIQVTFSRRTGLVNATIHNAGGGVARGVSYIIAHAGQIASGYVEHGILRADELVSVQTAIAARIHEGELTKVAAMVSARDRFGYGHAWTNEEKHQVYVTRFLRRPRYGACSPDSGSSTPTSTRTS